jgi:hypothetical protein
MIPSCSDGRYHTIRTTIPWQPSTLLQPQTRSQFFSQHSGACLPPLQACTLTSRARSPAVLVQSCCLLSMFCQRHCLPHRHLRARCAAFSTPAQTAQPSSLSATTDISKHEPDNESPVMLKSTLECHSTPKVFFDVRNDSDALFSYFEIRLNCIHDLRLMELATCRMSRAYLNSLAECIDYDTNMSIAQRQHATHIKNQGTRRQALRAEQRRLI